MSIKSDIAEALERLEAHNRGRRFKTDPASPTVLDDMGQIDAVTCEPLGTKGHWRYFAHLRDGSEIVLRKKSTQRKRFAHLFVYPVASGTSGVAACFSYSDKIDVAGHRAAFHVRAFEI